MGEKHESFSEVVDEMRKMPNYLIVDANSNFVFVRYADRLEDAHRREVEIISKDRDEMYKSEQEMVAKTKAWFDDYQHLKREVDSLNFKLMTAKSEQKTAANVIIEQTNKVEKLEREVAELRECLKEAIREKCPFTRMSCKHGEQCNYECGTDKWRKALEGEQER